MKIDKFYFSYHLHVYFIFYQLYKVFSEISLKTEGHDPLDELEESQSRPEPEVGAQKVEKIIEVEAVQAGPLGRDSLGESQHKRGLICPGGGVETLQYWGSGPEAGQQAARVLDPGQKMNWNSRYQKWGLHTNPDLCLP